LGCGTSSQLQTTRLGYEENVLNKKNLPDDLDKPLEIVFLGIDFVILGGSCELPDFVFDVGTDFVLVLDKSCDEIPCFCLIVFKVELDE
jgi:hypothetical protein